MSDFSYAKYLFDQQRIQGINKNDITSERRYLFKHLIKRGYIVELVRQIGIRNVISAVEPSNITKEHVSELFYKGGISVEELYNNGIRKEQLRNAGIDCSSIEDSNSENNNIMNLNLNINNITNNNSNFNNSHCIMINVYDRKQEIVQKLNTERNSEHITKRLIRNSFK